MKTLGVAKAALLGIFLNYYCYYTLRGSFIPGGTVAFLALACLGVGMDVIQQRHLRIGTEIKCWILYAIFAYITTALITMDSGSTSYINDIIKFVQRLMIVMMVAYICEREGSIRFGLQLMAITAAASAVAILMVIDSIQLKLDISSGANLSDNDVGAIMSFGCFAITFAWGRRKRTSLILSCLKVSAIIACLCVIFLAGSRKSIFAVVIMLAVLLVLCLPDYGRKLNIKRALTVLIIGAAAFFFISEALLPYAEQTSLYKRLLGRSAETAAESDGSRINLYVYALNHFVEHPLFGLGFNQFVRRHGTYTHSTYAEPLACSGLIGLLYLYPYYLMIKKQLYLIFRNKPGSYARLKQKEIFAYLCMFLFVGTGIPYVYKDVPCILLGTFVASQNISFRELRLQGYTSADY